MSSAPPRRDSTLIDRFLASMPSWIQALSAIAIVFLTFALLRVTSEQRDIADAANKIAKGQIEITRAINRPQVYFEGIRLTPDKSGDGKTVYGVAIVITNGGNLPALNMVESFKCHYGTTGTVNNPFEPLNSDGGSSILGPKQSIARQVCVLPEEVFEVTKDRHFDTFVVGEVTYRSAIDQEIRRVTRITRQIFIDSNNNYSFGDFGPHNCADDDCPPRGG